MLKVAFAFMSIVLLLSVAACGGSAAVSSTSASPATTPATSSVAEDADSRLPTPAGVVIYKGNLNGANLVPTVNLTFAADFDTIRINYRANIETAPGRARNEIVSIIDDTGKIRYNQIGPVSYAGDIAMTVEGLPPGITSESDAPGLVFHISDDAKPGQYTFQISVTISGRTYPLPCTINVL